MKVCKSMSLIFNLYAFLSKCSEWIALLCVFAILMLCWYGLDETKWRMYVM